MYFVSKPPNGNDAHMSYVTRPTCKNKAGDSSLVSDPKDIYRAQEGVGAVYQDPIGTGRYKGNFRVY